MPIIEFVWTEFQCAGARSRDRPIRCGKKVCDPAGAIA